MPAVSVAINVIGKPIQTALTLLSLDRYCGRHIDRIYFVEENFASLFARWRFQRQIRCFDLCRAGSHQFILDRFGDRIVYFRPKHFLFTYDLKPGKLAAPGYRHSIRYQYAWEHTGSDFLFLTHNDCHYHGDLIGAMLDRIGDHIGIGQIGQCWNCPAFAAGFCDGDRYLDYRPGYDELRRLYEQHPAGRAYHLRNFCASVRSNPWPLPECRINEWAAMINLHQARPVTSPMGNACPFGILYENMDIGVEWFRNVSLNGYRACNFPIYDYMDHLVGHPSLNDEEQFLRNEARALELLACDYPEETGGDIKDFLRVCYPDERLCRRILERFQP